MSSKSPLYRDYLELCKPRVVALMLLTSVIGMCLATSLTIPLALFFWASLGIGLVAGSAAACNHLVDRHIDAIMGRTSRRPIPTGRVPVRNAAFFAAVLGITGATILWHFVNSLTAILTVLTLVGYAGVYTLYLKRATPQNIVIGGAAGAAPPLLGWTAVTGQVDPYALLLVLIIFVWTPPHFWALAIHRHQDYAKADIPMLPITHGIAFTKLHILLYTILLFVVSLLPFLTHMSGLLYFICAVLLGSVFLYYAAALKFTDKPRAAIQTFNYSIIYLMALFVGMLVDHYFVS
jgi:protoheme IX farnesyltransferase